MLTAKRQTLGQLRQLQRLAARVIMRPLAPGYHMQRRWLDDRDTKAVVEEFIKPNDRLTSLQRIEIYNKQYWFRLIDCLYEDYPGLRAVLGRNRFNRLVREYLDKYPSRSYTLRNLSSRLVKFIEERPDLVAPRHDLALDMARFEWAQIEAFDGKALPVVTVDDLLGKNPDALQLGVQPYLTLLRLGYPLDDYVLQLKQDNLRGEASNAMEEPRAAAKKKRSTPVPRRREVFVVVHRFQNSLYYKRLDAEAYRLLAALMAGKTLTRALDHAFDNLPDPARIKQWFETWSALGWFCKPSTSRNHIQHRSNVVHRSRF